MPTRLAIVTARRPPHRRARRRTRVLVGVLAALIATLAPVESPVPLGPLDGLMGSAPAEAQPSTVVAGMPNPCTAPWQPAHPDGRTVVDPDTASLCVLGQPACSEHPLQPGSYLVLSTEFPDFCEATVLQSDLAAYQACRALTGYVIKTPAGECRMIRPTQCAPNMHRTRVNWCERVQRRTWSCPTGTTPTNRFNTCYQQPPDYTTTGHPACGPGAPSFAISSCEDYVGQDFVRASDLHLVPCGSFDTDDARSALQALTTPANAYWCQFDSQYLDVDCYGATATCTTSNAVCIKRASTTGGCYAIANALKCRKWQADFRDGSVSAEDVYLEGCAPCVVLPFSPTPINCPRDLLVDPRLSTEGRLEDTHQRRTDVGPSSSSRSFCTDPPRGRLVWESSHQVGLAIVNSPVILRVVDVPVTSRTFRYISVTGLASSNVKFWPTERQHFEYPGSTPSDPIVRAWPTFDDTLTFTNVDEIVGAYRLRPGSSTVFNSGPCLIRLLPDFRVSVTELWPDNDASEIMALFGADALDWWTDLNPNGLDPTLQRERTEARGLGYVGGMNAMELADELADRARDLTQEVRCNYGTDVWCNWRPPRPGYYRLVAAGAWYMTKLSTIRRWQQPQWLGPVNAALTNMYNLTRDGTCTRVEGSRSHADYDCLSQDLSWASLSAAEAGLETDLSALSQVTQTAEWLYTAAAGPNVRCPPRDLRVGCTGGAESQNYTETEPIGIVVHEVRVSTVAPDR